MTPSNVAFVATAAGITLMMSGREYAIGRDHPNFNRIKDALASKTYTDLPDLIDTRSAVRKFVVAAGLALENDQITLSGT
jgi:hypothetical protein